MKEFFFADISRMNDEKVRTDRNSHRCHTFFI